MARENSMWARAREHPSSPLSVRGTQSTLITRKATPDQLPGAIGVDLDSEVTGLPHVSTLTIYDTLWTTLKGLKKTPKSAKDKTALVICNSCRCRSRKWFAKPYNFWHQHIDWTETGTGTETGTETETEKWDFAFVSLPRDPQESQATWSLTASIVATTPFNTSALLPVRHHPPFSLFPLVAIVSRHPAGSLAPKENRQIRRVELLIT